MSHFQADCTAVVLGSYTDQYGGGNTKEYSILILDKNNKPQYAVSWYNEQQLTRTKPSPDWGLGVIAEFNRALRREESALV